MKIMDNTKYYRAKERVEQIKGFYNSVVSSIFIIIIVASVNYYVDEWRYAWFLWVVLGLAISIMIKALKIFNLTIFMDRGWEERKIQEFIQQEETKERWN